jgi:hypothetical protein
MSIMADAYEVPGIPLAPWHTGMAHMLISHTHGSGADHSEEDTA